MQEINEKKSNAVVNVLRFLWNLIKAFLISIGLFVIIVPILLFHFFGKGEFSTVKKQAIGKNEQLVLKIDLSGEIQSQGPNFTRLILFHLLEQRKAVYLSRLAPALRRAAKDARIKAIQVSVNQLTGSLADHEELRQIFNGFRGSGKPLHFHLNNLSTNTYFLASSGNFISLTPASELELSGPVFNLIYFGQALKKLGVELEVFRTGRYKSLVEPLTSDSPSRETLEVYGSLEKSIRDHLAQSIAQSQNKEIPVVNGWLRKSLFTAEEATTAGIISSVSYLHPVENLLMTSTGATDSIDLIDYLEGSADLDDNVLADGSETIGLIEAQGEIHMAASGAADDIITPDDLIKQAEWAAKNKSIKAVVAHISSPGGSATASDMIWKSFTDLAKEKPLVVSMGTYAASGGYYISVPAHKILAHPSTITGSIGVITALPNLAAFKEKYGVSFHVVTQSERAKIFNLAGGLTADDRSVMAKVVNDIYQTFLRRVSESRKMELPKVEQLAEGRVYTGKEALERGLVDQLGGLYDAFQVAKELAGLDKDKLYPIESYSGKEFNLRECLTSSLRLFECLSELEHGTMLRHSKRLFSSPFKEVEKRLMFLKSNLIAERYLSIWPGYLLFAIPEWGTPSFR